MKRSDIIAELKAKEWNGKMQVMPPDMNFTWKYDEVKKEYYLHDMNEKEPDIFYSHLTE